MSQLSSLENHASPTHLEPISVLLLNKQQRVNQQGGGVNQQGGGFQMH
jgi:hypothetical protein